MYTSTKTELTNSGKESETISHLYNGKKVVNYTKGTTIDFSTMNIVTEIFLVI